MSEPLQRIGQKPMSQHTHSTRSQDLPSEISEKKNQEKEKQIRTTKIATGIGLATLIGSGIAMKDGINEGFKKIGNLGRIISSLFAIPATVLTPFTFALGEYEEHKEKNPTKQGSSRLLEIVYPILSVAFAPMTAFEPLLKATKSKGHMITTLINLPHIAFTLFSYTGGRLFTLLKSCKLTFFNLSDEEKSKLENERKLVSTLGDIGSDHAAVTPEAGQAMDGWLNILDLCKGNFSAIKERFTEAPLTSFLGTFVGSIFWIPTFIGKSFDTIIRTLEMTDQLKNAVSEDSKVYKSAVKARDWWHTTATSDTFMGKLLTGGREFGKIMQAVASPMGMVSVVFPAFDHFRKGFNNEEALDAGNTVRRIDKGLNIAAFFGHCYFTVLYGLFVRLPQTVVTTTFYTCNIINKMRGITNSEDPKYLDPRIVRDKIFNPNKGWVKKLSDIAGNSIEKLTGKRALYDSIYKVVAEEECFRPIRENLSKQVFESEFQYTVTDELTKQEKIVTKKAKTVPPNKIWGEKLKEKMDSGEFLREAETRFRKYLKDASRFDEAKIEDFFTRGVYNRIETELKELINAEIKTCMSFTEQEKDHPSINDASTGSLVENKEKPIKPKLKSNDFFDMILHPVKHWNDIKEVLKFRKTIAQFVLSPINVLDFVNIVEMGDKKDPYWLQNWLLQESSIRNGDYKAGNIGELPTVLFHALQTAGKGLAHTSKALGAISSMAT
ncbi:MAG: hypothetical protein HY094_00785 [Candidatus Melainabacteria bacterium]|nr:hypothetical protein [Candidatus Melainabacteria bacterium]